MSGKWFMRDTVYTAEQIAEFEGIPFSGDDKLAVRKAAAAYVKAGGGTDDEDVYYVAMAYLQAKA